MDRLGLLGKTLAGHFSVDAVAGEGRFGFVYSGLHVGPKHRVAIKCIELPMLDATTKDAFLKRFREDHKAYTRVSKADDHFLHSIGSGMTTTEGGTQILYLVSDWLEGRSLADDLAQRREKNLPHRKVGDMLDLLSPIVDALARAHDAGLVHGHINTGAFFYADADGWPEIKVMDFGVYELVTRVLRELLPNAEPHRLFAPDYGTPEQFDASLGPTGLATDVYAFALVVLAVLRDRPPFDGVTFDDGASHALDPTSRPTPRRFGILVGDAVENVMARAVARIPSDRWPNARDFWSALVGANRQDTIARALRTKTEAARSVSEAPRVEAPKPVVQAAVASAPVDLEPKKPPALRPRVKTPPPAPKPAPARELEPAKQVAPVEPPAPVEQALPVAPPAPPPEPAPPPAPQAVTPLDEERGREALALFEEPEPAEKPAAVAHATVTAPTRVQNTTVARPSEPQPLAPVDAALEMLAARGVPRRWVGAGALGTVLFAVATITTMAMLHSHFSRSAETAPTEQAK